MNDDIIYNDRDDNLHRILYNANGLKITQFEYDWTSYLLKTSLYSVTVCERYGDHDIWIISVLDNSIPQKKMIEMTSHNLPDFMDPFDGHCCQTFRSAEEVDKLINRLLLLRPFL